MPSDAHLIWYKITSFHLKSSWNLRLAKTEKSKVVGYNKKFGNRCIQCFELNRQSPYRHNNVKSSALYKNSGKSKDVSVALFCFKDFTHPKH